MIQRTDRVRPLRYIPPSARALIHAAQRMAAPLVFLEGNETMQHDRQAVRTGRGIPAWLAGLLLGLLVCFALSGTALAAAFSPKVYADFSYGQDRVLQVYAFEKDRTHYLFLPSGWPAGAFRFYFPQETLFLAGQEVHSGDALTALVPGSTVVFQNQKGNKALTVCVMQGKGIPSLFVTTESGSIKALERSKANVEKGSLTLINRDGSLGQSRKLEQVHGHGNSTFNANFQKRAFQIRFEQKTDLLGMGKAKAYVLLADWLDLSLLRNRISMAMAKQAGVANALDATSVNVYFNGCYHGVYLLAEKVGINENRVPIYDLEAATEKINELPLSQYKPIKEIDKQYQQYYAFDIPNDPEDITGGYIVELIGSARFHKKDGGFVTSNDMCLAMTEPTYATMAQTRYIGEIFDRFNRAILNAEGTDPVSGARYDELFDVDSLARVLVLQQISKNFDYEKNSLYFYKDRDSVDRKVYAGPVWDFDRTYGNVNTGYWVNSPVIDLYARTVKPWYLYGNLYNLQADFLALVKQVYQESYRPALEILLGLRKPLEGSPLRSLEGYYQELAPSANMNFTRWNSFAVKGIFNHSGQTFEASYRNLGIFLQKRMDALNADYALAAE